MKAKSPSCLRNWPQDENRVISFTRNGADVTSREQIYATIHVYHVTSFHARSHLGANRLVKNLLAANYRPLLPEAAFGTLLLNWHMLQGQIQPGGRQPGGERAHAVPVTRGDRLVHDGRD